MNFVARWPERQAKELNAIHRELNKSEILKLWFFENEALDKLIFNKNEWSSLLLSLSLFFVVFYFCIFPFDIHNSWYILVSRESREMPSRIRNILFVSFIYGDEQQDTSFRR